MSEININEIIDSSIKSLNSNKIRSFLTILGVVIGVFAVVMLVSLVKGVENYVTGEFESLGSNLIFVSPGNGGVTQDPALTFTNNKLAMKHVDLIKNYAGDAIINISPIVHLGVNATYKNKSYYSQVTGVSEDLDDITNLTLESGRFVEARDVSSQARVAVIAVNPNKNLFGDVDAVGKNVILNGESYEIIGVLRAKGEDYDEQILIPQSTLEKRFDISTLSYIIMNLSGINSQETQVRQVKLALLRDLKNDEFNIQTQSDLLKSFQQILAVLSAGLAAIASISLLVGGIGIMNIMLVTVTERIKEIGLRKALGATRLDIALQFLTESVLLSIGGGLGGLLLGYIGTFIAQRFFEAEITWWSVILSLSFSGLVGVIFGTYPAISAAKKDPIEALRYE